MRKKILIVSIIIILLSPITYFSFFNKKSNSKRFKKEYEILNKSKNKYPYIKIPLNNRIKYATVDEILKILNNGTGTIYIGSSSSVYSRNIINVLLNVAKDNHLKEIYYLNIDEVCDISNLNQTTGVISKCNDDKKVLSLQKKLQSIIYDDKIKQKPDNFFIVPTVIFVLNGTVTGINIRSVPTHTDPYSELVQSQIDGLKEIYDYGIKNMLNNN